MSGVEVEASLPQWGLWLLDARKHPYQFIVHYGGRAGGKSHTYARALAWLGTQEPLRILCIREIQNSLADSSKETIENAIEALGLQDYYTILQREIRGTNGTTFAFRGLSNVTAGRIQSFEGADIAWIEEGQDITEDSWGLLEPTIRKPGAQIWISFNPKRPTDIVYRLFVSNPVQPPNSFVNRVNYTDNPFNSERILQSVEFTKRMEPEVFRHRYLGELAPDLGVLRVLPMKDLEQAVALYPQHASAFKDARPDIGLDVADLGEDKNAVAVRRGPLLDELDTWHGGASLGDTARRADRWATERGAWRFFYDAGGIGASVRSTLYEMERRPYLIEGITFSASVAGEDRMFDTGRSNKQAFFRRNAQMAWALKMRLQNTARLADGEDVQPADCLFINPALLEEPATANLLFQLNQPTWDDGDGHRIRIKKAQPGEKSPDMFDATCLAFAKDSADGLRVLR